MSAGTGVDVDVDTMVAVADRLTSCARSLVERLQSVPAEPDAGAATETVSALLSWTLKAATTVASTASTTADEVATAMASYTGTDHANATGLTGTTQVLR